MQVGLIGLGRMGANMSRRWIKDGHRVVGYARTAATVITRDGRVVQAATAKLLEPAKEGSSA